ncbi:MAG TPA: indolepyruvate oxidoreductase subunit beta [Humidesulfovibrio sp.]|uniref:indolepyruvate oxidoreductase subunit beta n=1 Tax=Humidesulfovibrio sp. TaxID=2910988 RepID=UPI002C8CDC3E|nr:indolepyruvate oxidoreductase subunit beta [Humidesulfovibrio sp.]HWR05048.1 indolepyruvate oxidoreductase subunit beta [Humidesulfovibrio sp.]
MSTPNNTRLRIFMTGVGGQGTLTATTLLARAALAAGLPVTSGEIHGMAQRGGVVESTLLIGYKSPKIGHGEADILLGFEPLETLRALPYLKPGGLVLSSTECLAPLSVATGKETAPSVEEIRAKITARCATACFLPCRTLGLQAGAVQSGNIALLGALCALGVLPFGREVVEETIRATMKPKVAEINLKALNLGAACPA